MVPLRVPTNPEAIARFCRANRIRKLSVFGSALRDDFRPDSDVDVLVEFEPDVLIGLMGLVRLELELCELFGREVDLSTVKGLHPRFRDRVLAEAEVLYAA